MDTPGVLFCALGGEQGGHSFFRSRSVDTCESWIRDGEKAPSQDSIFMLFHYLLDVKTKSVA